MNEITLINTMVFLNLLISTANVFLTSRFVYKTSKEMLNIKSNNQVRLVGMLLIILFGGVLVFTLINMYLVIYNLFTGYLSILAKNISDLTIGIAVFFVTTIFLSIRASHLTEEAKKEESKK